MKKRRINRSTLGMFHSGLALISLVVFFSGCVALQPMPTNARAGDTITLAVGSADGMTAANTTVEFYTGPDPSLATPVSIPVRSIVKVYPDKTSHAWLGDDPRKISKRSGHGGWLSVIVVDLPPDPALIPEGVGVIRVTTNGEVVFPRFAATPNGTDIQINILPGLGSPNPFNYAAFDGASAPGDLGELEALPQAIIVPPVPAEGEAELVSYGAIEMQVTAPIVAMGGGSIEDAGIAVVLDDQPQVSENQVNLIWNRTGDDFNIMLISPVGMYSYQSRVSIVPLFPEYPYKIDGAPVLQSITYYDLDGAVVSGPVPSISTIDNTFF